MTDNAQGSHFSVGILLLTFLDAAEREAGLIFFAIGIALEIAGRK